LQILYLKVPWNILLIEVAATLFATFCLDLSSTMFLTLVFATEKERGEGYGFRGDQGRGNEDGMV
jgi:hypothetical protein